MSDKSAILSAGAGALSNSAILVGVIGHLTRKKIIADSELREIYEYALMLLEQGQMDDDSGVFDAARELIAQHLRPNENV